MKKTIALLAFISLIGSACKKNTTQTNTNSNNNTTPTSTWTQIPGIVQGVFCFDQASNFWDAATCTGVLKYDGTNWTTFTTPTLSALNVNGIAYFNNAIYTYAGGSSACAGTDGLNVYSSGTWSLNPSPKATFTFFHNKFKNELWFFKDTTNGFVIHALKTDNTWYTLNCTINFGAPTYISAMACDNQGKVWMAGNGYNSFGLIKYDGTIWTQYRAV